MIESHRNAETLQKQLTALQCESWIFQFSPKMKIVSVVPYLHVLMCFYLYMFMLGVRNEDEDIK